MKKYDVLIVGSGLYGAVMARQLMDDGKKFLLLINEIILQEMYIPVLKMEFMSISMVLIFSIQIVIKSGIM